MILEDADVITLEYLPRDLAAQSGYAPPSLAPRERTVASEPGGFVLPAAGLSLEELETSLVRQAIERSGGNQTRAAELLGISRDQLRYRLKKLDTGADAQPTVTEATT